MYRLIPYSFWAISVVEIAQIRGKSSRTAARFAFGIYIFSKKEVFPRAPFKKTMCGCAYRIL